jgi:hypothetical protein
MIVEMWRHGARAAAKDTFNQEYVRKEGPGNLIGNGMRMHYVLGQSIRKKYYDDLFSGDVLPTDYEVTTSQVQRTMLSAYSHMMGIYPLGQGLITTNDDDTTKMPPFAGAEAPSSSMGNNALEGGYRAIPVNVIPEATDNIFMRGLSTLCPGADTFINDYFKKIDASEDRINLVKEVGAVITKAGYSPSQIVKGLDHWTI